MTTVEEVLEWAEGHADALTQEMAWHPDSIRGGWWDAADPQAKARIRARATAALAFLEQFTGSDSRWSENAHKVFDSHGENQSMPSGARAVGDMLREWTNMVRSGQATPRLVEPFRARAASSTDLLEQVRRLNSDKDVAPAAPIVLAGAALEIALRSALNELSLTATGRPGISSYAEALRQAGVLNTQDIKDVTQMAGLRNNAAHGEHELLSRERAGLMEQQVNLFLNRLEEAVRQSI